MKLRIEACDSVPRVMLWWGRQKRFIVAAGFLLVSVAGGIWVICCGDSTSPLILAVAGLGALNGQAMAARLRATADDEKIMEMSPEMPFLTHLKSVLRLGLTVLRAKSVAMTLWDKRTGERLDWKMRCGQSVSALVTAKPEPGSQPRRSEFSSAIYVRKEQGIAASGVNWEDQPIESARLLEHLSALWHGSFKTLLLSYLDLGSRWQGTVAYINAPVSSCHETELITLKEVVDAARSGANLFEMACNSARANERRCLALDLHDGVTQSLIATELQIALLERESTAAGNRNNQILQSTRETLRRETRKLRRQIEELQRGEHSDPLRETAERLLNEFESETGIATTLVCEMKGEHVPPRLGFELVYLLQEALSNVRKHSRAKRVDVCLLVEDQARLYVQDDGCGLAFSGKFDLEELDAMGTRPRTICKRVQANGGDLELESLPGGGVRLEISLPLSPIHEPQETVPVAMPQLSRRKPKSTDSVRYMQRAS